MMSEADTVAELNKHFIQSGQYTLPAPPLDSTLSLPNPNVSNSFLLFHTTPEEIANIINDLKPNTAAGFDDIQVAPLKYVSDLISYVLSNIGNKMIDTGIFPDELKIARVTPIHKGGNDYTANNYRPISVLPVLSKVFEKLLNVRLQSFLVKYNIICDAQYGFRKNRSSEMALLDIKNEIIRNIERRLYTIGLFLDLRKAFDSVNHQILLRKLESIGIRGVPLELFRNYLANRYQYVLVNGIPSAKLRLIDGVPQGSILGPILFNLYINDLPAIPESPKIIMYADDTNIFFTDMALPQLETRVNQYLHLLSHWLHINKLQLNISKTNYVVFTPINKPLNYTIDLIYRNNRLKQSKAQKFLGVWFENNLSWNTHVSKLTAELSKTVGCLYKIRDIIPLWLKKTLYYSLFFSKLSYCALVWGTTSTQNYNKLLLLQKKVLRIFENYYGRPRHLPTHELFLKHSLLKANQIYCYKLLQYIRDNKLHNTSSPVTAPQHNLRRLNRPMPSTRTNYGRQHTDYQIPSLLNKVQKHINFRERLSKTQIKNVLLEQLIAYS